MTFTRACLAAPAALTLTLTLACDVEEITADTSTLVAFEEPAGAELEVEEPAIADAAAQPDARAVDDLADVDAAAQPDARAVDELADVDGDAPRASF
ncbi:MAG: hypothetical protein KC636_31790, partial [Myxococcales bacterium]|nr:hypothetical protein [Myxococcales bacterium]